MCFDDIWNVIELFISRQTFTAAVLFAVSVCDKNHDKKRMLSEYFAIFGNMVFSHMVMA